MPLDIETGFSLVAERDSRAAHIAGAAMRTLLVLVGLLLMFGTGTTRAAELRGQDDPRFQSALALWLDDDEETALPELAALAAGGNRAAQVLLAQIDVTLWIQGPWLVGLPRKERNALLRAPGGLSGRSWMQAAADDTPLAQLWLVQPTPAATAETALAFAAMGEHRAARNTCGRSPGGTTAASRRWRTTRIIRRTCGI